jgi:DNA-binding winged helix-turn-helix (wHTH) protein
MSPASYRFLAAELQTARRVLRVDGRDCQIGARAFDLLLALIERRDRVVSKNELLEIVWPRMVVEENNLPVQVSSLRKLLGANAIATVPGRGYRSSPRSWSGRRGAAPRSTIAPIGATDDPGLASEPPPMGSAVFRPRRRGRLCSRRCSNRTASSPSSAPAASARAGWRASSPPPRPRRFRDGVSWIELSGLADPALLPHALAQPLGLSVPERDGAQTLVDALTRRQMLLVLDNCEHLLEPLRVLVDVCSTPDPGLRVLATSQEPLRVQAEQQVRLEPLAVPRDASVPDARCFGALLLFESRVRATSPRFELADADLPLAIDICRQARRPAARDRARGGARTVARPAHGARPLARALPLLTAGTRTRAAPPPDVARRDGMEPWPPRGAAAAPSSAASASSAAASRWSWRNRCAPTTSATPGPCSSSSPRSSRSRWSSPKRPSRFAIACSNRRARSRSSSSRVAGETRAVVQRHAEDDAAVPSAAPTTATWTARCAPTNTRGWCCPRSTTCALRMPGRRATTAIAPIALGLATHAGPLIDYSTEFTEWVLAQRENLAAEGVDATTAARYWRARAAVNMLGPLSVPELLDAAQRATAAYRALGRPRRLFTALRLVAIWRRNAGDRDGARAAIDEADTLIEPDWPAEFRIVVLRFRAHASRETGGHEEARRQYAEGVRLARAAGDWRLGGDRAHARWPSCSGRLGEHDRAARDLAELLERCAIGPPRTAR